MEYSKLRPIFVNNEDSARSILHNLRYDIRKNGNLYIAYTKLLLLIYKPGLDPCFTISYTTTINYEFNSEI